ncbi:MAG: glycoside hydrolase, partial [Candidatus Acidiferrum sp.]
YRVYRSEQQGARGEAIPPALVPTPALRDAAVQPGHRYWYSVTALDRAGNESAAGAPAMVEVP